MKSWIAFAVLAAAVPAWAAAERLCDAARADLERVAQAQGLQAEVRCRPMTNRSLPEQAELRGLGLPTGATLKSGPWAWPVSVQSAAGRSYVQRVPVTAVVSGPAWVSTHDLSLGAQLQPGDVELQARRWPEGVEVEATDAPPQGRLRQALRAGEVLPRAALLPPGALQRGDPVTAVLAEGAMEIRLPAHLLAPARVGERARVQASGRTAALEGRLLDAQTLQVDSE